MQAPSPPPLSRQPAREQPPPPPRREGKKAVRKRTLDIKTPSPEPEGAGPSEPLVPRPSALARMQMRIAQQLPPVPVYAPRPPQDLQPQVDELFADLSIEDIEQDPTEY